MITLIKFMNKDLDLDLFKQEYLVAGLPEYGMLLAGFTRMGRQQYEPFASTQIISSQTDPGGGPDITDSADPGELRFRYEVALTAPQEAALDALLIAHDATQKSDIQIEREKDVTAKDQFIETFHDWDTLTALQKDNRTQELFRVVARLLDRGAII